MQCARCNDLVNFYKWPSSVLNSRAAFKKRRPPSLLLTHIKNRGRAFTLSPPTIFAILAPRKPHPKALHTASIRYTLKTKSSSIWLKNPHLNDFIGPIDNSFRIQLTAKTSRLANTPQRHYLCRSARVAKLVDALA